MNDFDAQTLLYAAIGIAEDNDVPDAHRDAWAEDLIRFTAQRIEEGA